MLYTGTVEKPTYGALVERGRVKSAGENGIRVESLARLGVVTPPLKAIGGGPHEAGDLVYFFLFDDGRGLVLAKFA